MKITSYFYISISIEYSSSENDDDDDDNDDDDDDKIVVQKMGSANSLVNWLVAFLCIWQSLFVISDRAIQMLLKFLNVFFKVLTSNSSLLKDVSSGMPRSLFTFHKYLGTDEDEFVKYVVCPSCYSIYLFKDCFKVDDSGENVPIQCPFKRFPNHTHESRRLPCNAPLLVKVNKSGGKSVYKPRYVYAYQPIKQSLQRLLNTPGFAEKLEHWRARVTVSDTKADVYDGQVWKDFQTDKFNYFLKKQRSVGVMLNVDFFQPYKHVHSSYGVIYLTIMNLPRSERFKQQNVLIVGIIPAFEHEPDTFNPFIKPMVEELKEFWDRGIRLYTFESPSFKLLFRIALMCVACDIPAARKLCGFKGHNANYGCSRCKKFFPGGFGKKDFSGFNRCDWPKRNLHDHRLTCDNIKNAIPPQQLKGSRQKVE